ncbi:hypothetical protein PTE30175_02047 [Pandoraea terrae]|uniref:Nucleotidyltransferase n=1 Tax=Pandoraea terrae TaxID=1537710 RepID=A0A5E4UMR4_9BURK|nr:nucleotidyl transferase AbiEii/AbiGii toxin family protein [Pandoraea terrae]VVE00833.1 hypothetical protein PTE30175_02047 [Pandoraea terrae]
MPKLRLKTPVPPDKAALLRMMASLTAEMHLDYFVVGATARDMLMHYLHGFPIRRASPDIDFAIALSDWQMFDRVRAALLAYPSIAQDARIPHRLIYTPEDSAAFPLDLVPFGDVADQHANVVWPPDMAVVMSVVGYEDALAGAVLVEIADDLDVPVASIPGLVVTKFIAWRGRGMENEKDAVDLRYLIEHYHDAGNLDRLYGEEAVLLTACEFVLDHR